MKTHLGQKLLICWGKIMDVETRMLTGEMETSEGVGWLEKGPIKD